jgi:hypothetical protein
LRADMVALMAAAAQLLTRRHPRLEHSANAVLPQLQALNSDLRRWNDQTAPND